MRLSFFADQQAVVELIIGGGLVALVVIGFLIRGLWEQQRRRRVKQALMAADTPYMCRDLLNGAERQLYARLRPVAEAQGLQVLAKLPMSLLLTARSDLDANTRATILSQLPEQPCAFVLAEHADLSPRLMVLLEDSAADAPAQQEAHVRLDTACAAAGLPVLRVCSADGLARRVSNALRSAGHSQTVVSQ